MLEKETILKDNILNKYITSLKEHFNGRLNNVLLFGSRARGESSSESDYDCIIVLKNLLSEDESFIEQLELDILNKDFALFSSFPITSEEFKTRKYEPFLMNAKKEGVYL